MAAADNIMFPRTSWDGSNHAMSSTLKFLVSSYREAEEDGCYIGGGRGIKDTVNFLRLQELFFVRMSVCSGSEGNDVVSLTGPDPGSVERAKCYIMAMCCPQAYTDIPCDPKLTYLLFDKQDCPLRVSLERDYHIFLRHFHSPSSSSSSVGNCYTTNDFVRVQGGEEDVSVAVSKIKNMIIEEEQLHPIMHPHPPMTPTRKTDVGSTPPMESAPLDDSGSHYYNGRIENAKLLEVLGSLSMEDRNDVVKSYHGKTNMNYPILPFNSLQPSLGPTLQKRIDYFVELDFPQEMVRSILESLGPTASYNEVMNRLMKGSPAVHPISKASGPHHYHGNVTGDGSVGQSVVSEQKQPSQQQKVSVDPSKLRHIVIDGSNVAMKHGNGQVFSCRGIEIVVDYFKNRGHDKITVFVPEWRKESSHPDSPITDQHVLEKLEREKHLVYTPSRKLNGRRIICYDDRYIVRLAHKEGGVIVSDDQFRDLMQENPEWKKVIEQRLLQFAFAADFFMPPDDPLGKLGPTLDQFLSKDSQDMEGGSNNILPEGQRPSSKRVCPHIGKCTFGKKCRYYHPDREPQPPPTLQQQQQQQQSTHQQKPELKVGSGLSGSHCTPTTSSRSDTPSPSPDTRTHGNAAYSMVKSERGHLFNQGSSDDPYHRRSFGGRAMVVRTGSDIVAPNSTSIDFSELGTTPLPQGVPSIKLSDGVEHKMLGHQPTRWVESSHVLSDGGDPHMERGRHPHNHTFPLAQLPHQEVRRENVTGDHSYLINQRATLVSQGHSLISQGTPLSSSRHLSDHLGHPQQHRHHHHSQLHENRVSDNATITLLPRGTQQSQYMMQSSSSPSPYSQHHPPTAHHRHFSQLPLSSHHPQSSYNFPTNPSGLQDHYQTSPSSHLPSPSSLIRYGGVTGNIYPSGYHANHVMMSSPSGYNTSHSSGSVSINQSTLPLQNMHHQRHSQPLPTLHAAYHHPQQGVPTALLKSEVSLTR